MASATPGIVQNVNVLMTVSIVPSANGMRSPGRSRNSTSIFVWRGRFCQTNHSWIGFERVNLVYSCGIVVGKVHARTYTDFENCRKSSTRADQQFTRVFVLPEILRQGVNPCAGFPCWPISLATPGRGTAYATWQPKLSSRSAP
jgi:hypothetical protein